VQFSKKINIKKLIEGIKKKLINKIINKKKKNIYINIFLNKIYRDTLANKTVTSSGFPPKIKK
jgi:hypothetical protein